jgi:hypothetical protein
MGRKKKEKQIEVPMAQEIVTENEVETMRQELDQARIELEKTRIEIEAKKKELGTLILPKRELSEEEQAIQDKQIKGFVKNDALKEKNEAQRAYDNVMVTGKFINRRAPGNPAKLTYYKHLGDVDKWYTFEDGKVYTIKRGFADQINEHYHRPIFVQKDGELDPANPSQIHHVDTSNKCYAFVPVSF